MAIVLWGFAVLLLVPVIFRDRLCLEARQRGRARRRDIRRTLRATLALDSDPLLWEQHLVAEAREDTIFLHGWVDSPLAEETALRVVRDLPGIHQVQSTILVRGVPPGPAAASRRVVSTPRSGAASSFSASGGPGTAG